MRIDGVEGTDGRRPAAVDAKGVPVGDLARAAVAEEVSDGGGIAAVEMESDLEDGTAEEDSAARKVEALSAIVAVEAERRMWAADAEERILVEDNAGVVNGGGISAADAVDRTLRAVLVRAGRAFFAVAAPAGW